MRKLLLAVTVLAVIALATPLTAQVVASDAYQIGYCEGFGLYRIINTGQIGSPIDAATNFGTVCADIYMFDDNQEMLSCCSCPLTANGLTHISDTTTLTGAKFVRGVVKIVADAGCDETNITQPVNAGLRAFQVNAQVPPFTAVTETLFQPAPLTAPEQQFLGQACSFVHYLGSGSGRCICFANGV